VIALRCLGAAIRSVTAGLVTDAIVTTDRNVVVLRVPLAGLRLFWPPAKARALAGALMRAADRIDKSKEESR
jgi:hypothetical protein